MRMTRRDFLVCAAGAMVGGCVSAPRLFAPTDRPLAVAIVGTNGRGRWIAGMVERLGGRVAALCDVDSGILSVARAKLAQPKGVLTFTDYRRMLDFNAAFDAVFITTPDHTHAPVAIQAMARGKHVYVEAPLTRTLDEAARFQRVAKQRGVVVQMGNTICATDVFRRNVELVRSGILGEVRHVLAWTGASAWRGTVPAGGSPVPASLAWDAWLGTAALRPWQAGVYHPHAWHGLYDFGTGQLGDVGAQVLALPFHALDLTVPLSAHSVAQAEQTADGFPRASTVTFAFGRGMRWARQEVSLVWREGSVPEEVLALPCMAACLRDVATDTGVVLCGSKGFMFCAGRDGAATYLALGNDATMVPVAEHPAVKNVAMTLPRAPGGCAIAEFMQACQGRGTVFSDVGRNVALTESLLIGCVAQRMNTRVAWQADKRQFVNDEQADVLIRPFIRKGWEF